MDEPPDSDDEYENSFSKKRGKGGGGRGSKGGGRGSRGVCMIFFFCLFIIGRVFKVWVISNNS